MPWIMILMRISGAAIGCLPSRPSTARNAPLRRGFLPLAEKKQRVFFNRNPSAMYKHMDLMRVHYWELGRWGELLIDDSEVPHSLQAMRLANAVGNKSCICRWLKALFCMTVAKFEIATLIWILFTMGLYLEGQGRSKSGIDLPGHWLYPNKTTLYLSGFQLLLQVSKQVSK